MDILTERLRLRPLTERDMASFMAYRNEPEVAHWQSFALPYSLDEAQSLFRECDASLPLMPRAWRQIAIASRLDDTLLGDCAVCLSGDGQQAELGITLAPKHQGCGYASEAFRALFDWLFTQQGLHRVHAACDPDNHASARLLRRVGMRQEGHFKRSLWLKGQWVDDLVFGLLREEWQAQR
ncbi:N-acetyltransferase [Chitinimonas prasina]|uniref:N-acetyltransferase n=1 Tax=Chitinimonas prasina TaxID=1434937 RepID=A0ABQ5YLG2_9NEIS|nr:GNAT family protein [Chitinimonas prasina]GLR15268.1 N-acetyltransferase [Chitinimonas prasina]